ncbi:hypothetical protein BFC20_10740 [Brochothrix thermosphacta]|uniref:hypothetical protein n=1 Tax=Brochothrix thermosphacta TaxID=2756 RepID=UPI000E7636A6|nr:hypothetical protein [Brochothrix thermosphacta]ANZ98146.1 hypothetical protein BFC20_10740 [Brochothrix thermosphacta]
MRLLTERELDEIFVVKNRQQETFSIEEFVAFKVKQELSKQKPKQRQISKKWLDLRKEINDFVKSELEIRTNMSYNYCQQTLYLPIKSILGIDRIDDMTDEQAVIASKVVDYISNN